MRINLGEKMYYLDNKSQNIFEVRLIGIETSLEMLRLYRLSQGTILLQFLNKVGKNVFASKFDALNKVDYEVTLCTSNYIVIDKSTLKKNIDLISSCKSINEVIDSRNINYLYHFTNALNLESILKYNLLSIYELQKRNIMHAYNDSQRLDHFFNRNSFSLSFPNDYYLNRLMRDHPERTYIILEYDVKILNFLVEPPYFCMHNAARTDAVVASGVAAFNQMFANEFYARNPQSSLVYLPTLSKRPAELPLCFPSDSQAEILIKGEINSIYINRIIFKDSIDPFFKNLCVQYGKRCIIDNRYFKNRDLVYEEINHG